MKIIQSADVIPQKWSGGTTSELFIFPEGSEFSKENYTLRISLATVEQAHTTFTTLPNVTRTLLVLKGSQLLQHEEHHTADVQPWQQDTFSGDWLTQCTGTSTNFNVMCRGNLRAKTEVLVLTEATDLSFIEDGQLRFLFVAEGTVLLNSNLLHAFEGAVINETVQCFTAQGTRIVLVTYPHTRL